LVVKDIPVERYERPRDKRLFEKCKKDRRVVPETVEIISLVNDEWNEKQKRIIASKYAAFNLRRIEFDKGYTISQAVAEHSPTWELEMVQSKDIKS